MGTGGGEPEPTLQVQVWNRVFKVRTPIHTHYAYGYVTCTGWLDPYLSLVVTVNVHDLSSQ